MITNFSFSTQRESAGSELMKDPSSTSATVVHAALPPQFCPAMHSGTLTSSASVDNSAPAPSDSRSEASCPLPEPARAQPPAQPVVQPSYGGDLSGSSRPSRAYKRSFSDYMNPHLDTGDATGRGSAHAADDDSDALADAVPAAASSRSSLPDFDTVRADTGIVGPANNALRTINNTLPSQQDAALVDELEVEDEHVSAQQDFGSASLVFGCPSCTKVFASRVALQRHSTMHSGQRPYACTHCHASFRCSSHLKRHERLHTGEKPYFCDNCDRSYADSTSLLRHREATHNVIPYPCGHCERGFSLERELRQHLQEVHAISLLPANGHARILCETLRQRKYSDSQLPTTTAVIVPPPQQRRRVSLDSDSPQRRSTSGQSAGVGRGNSTSAIVRSHVDTNARVMLKHMRRQLVEAEELDNMGMADSENPVAAALDLVALGAERRQPLVAGYPEVHRGASGARAEQAHDRRHLAALQPLHVEASISPSPASALTAGRGLPLSDAAALPPPPVYRGLSLNFQARPPGGLAPLEELLNGGHAQGRSASSLAPENDCVLVESGAASQPTSSAFGVADNFNRSMMSSSSHLLLSHPVDSNGSGFNERMLRGNGDSSSLSDSNVHMPAGVERHSSARRLDFPTTTFPPNADVRTPRRSSSATEHYVPAHPQEAVPVPAHGSLEMSARLVYRVGYTLGDVHPGPSTLVHGYCAGETAPSFAKAALNGQPGGVMFSFPTERHASDFKFASHQGEQSHMVMLPAGTPAQHHQSLPGYQYAWPSSHVPHPMYASGVKHAAPVRAHHPPEAVLAWRPVFSHQAFGQSQLSHSYPTGYCQQFPRSDEPQESQVGHFFPAAGMPQQHALVRAAAPSTFPTFQLQTGSFSGYPQLHPLQPMPWQTQVYRTGLINAPAAPSQGSWESATEPSTSLSSTSTAAVEPSASLPQIAATAPLGRPPRRSSTPSQANGALNSNSALRSFTPDVLPLPGASLPLVNSANTSAAPAGPEADRSLHANVQPSSEAHAPSGVSPVSHSQPAPSTTAPVWLSSSAVSMMALKSLRQPQGPPPPLPAPRAAPSLHLVLPHAQPSGGRVDVSAGHHGSVMSSHTK